MENFHENQSLKSYLIPFSRLVPLKILFSAKLLCDLNNVSEDNELKNLEN